MSLDINKIIAQDSCEIILKKSTLEDKGDARLRRFKDYALFILAVLTIASAFIYAGNLLIHDPNNKWATVIETNIITGLLAYIPITFRN